ncbi:MAG TPA: LysE family transporter [Mycobacteriales bacterium]|jgi:threonine/homoserine/homoserine lactone efflux protein|nr:LysE family transporter [Mycobacteriales bacterium]
MTAALLTGLGLGLFVAAQVGPIWLLCARSSLRYGAPSGLAIGAGAAIVDLAYAALGVAGAASLVQIDALRLTLGLVGAGFLLYLGTRTLWHAARVRLGAEGEGEVLSPREAFRTSLAATASNPTTIASWAAIFGAASVGHVADTAGTALVMLAAIGVGSFAWFAVLSTAAGRLGRRLSDRHLRVVDALSGTGIGAFGGLLAWRTLRGVS